MNNLLIGAAILGAVGVTMVVLIVVMFSTGRSALPIDHAVVPAVERTVEPAVEMMKPKVIRIIPITPDQPPSAPDTIGGPPPAAETPAAAEPEAQPPRRNGGDICARYGGHRVDYGRRWRCVYPHKRHR